MYKIVIINGSPKPQQSASRTLIDKIEGFLEKKPRVYHASQLIRQENNFTEISKILKADVLLFVFPLYIDSLPAHLIKFLTIIEKEKMNVNGNVPIVYAVCNCGFFEAEHNLVALDIVKNFSARLGMSWGYGIGIGGGGFVTSQSKNISPKGSAANVYTALCELAKAMETDHAKKPNVFLTPNIPRFMYKFSGNLSWYLLAMKNGSLRSLKAKPHDFKR